MSPPTDFELPFDRAPCPVASPYRWEPRSGTGWSRSSQRSRSLPPCRRRRPATRRRAGAGASQQAAATAAQAAAVRTWTGSRMTRDLVRQPPPGAPPAWLSGDTRGAGLRWTHGGMAAAAIGRIFFTLGRADYVCSAAPGRAQTARTRTWCSPPRTASATGPDGAAPPGGRPTGCSYPASTTGGCPTASTPRNASSSRPAGTAPGGAEPDDFAFVQVTVATLARGRWRGRRQTGRGAGCPSSSRAVRT